MSVTNTAWTPADWRAYPASQQPSWPVEAAARAALEELQALPPLVFAGEARDLEAALGEVANGRAFLLQAGDCAESFRDFSAVSIREKLKIFLQMSVVLIYGSGLPLVKVGGSRASSRSRDPSRRSRSATSSCPRSSVTSSTTTRRRPRRARRIRPGSCAPTTSPRRRSTSCGPSRAAVSPISGRSTPGTRSSSPARRKESATCCWPPRSSARSTSCVPAASTSRRRPGCTASTCGRATRASCSTTRKR